MKHLFCLGLLTMIAAASAEAAVPASAKYGGKCAYNLTKGLDVPTDCSVSLTQPSGETLCFTDDAAKTEFSKNLPTNITVADAYYTKLGADKVAQQAMADAAVQMDAASKQLQQASEMMKGAQGMGQVPAAPPGH